MSHDAPTALAAMTIVPCGGPGIPAPVPEAVDVLFQSAARRGPGVMAVVLTAAGGRVRR